MFAALDGGVAMEAGRRQSETGAGVRVTLGTDAFELAWREGYAMTLDDAVRYALDGTAGHDD